MRFYFGLSRFRIDSKQRKRKCKNSVNRIVKIKKISMSFISYSLNSTLNFCDIVTLFLHDSNPVGSMIRESFFILYQLFMSKKHADIADSYHA